MNWLKSVGGFFKGLFSSRTVQAILKGIRDAAPYVEVAMELAGTAAAVCGGPTGRTVENALAFADSLGVKAALKRNATDAEIGTALRDITVNALKLKFPDANTSTLNRAVEIAVGALKAS